MFRTGSLWLLASLGLVAFDATPATAADDESYRPGYVQVDWSRLVGDREPSVQIQLERPLLKLIAAASREEGQDLDDLIGQIAFIRVQVYDDLDLDDAKILAEVDIRASELTRSDWTTIAKVRDDQQRIHVMMKADEEERILGFVVFVANDDSLAFVNIGGVIDPETFGAKLSQVAIKLTGVELDLSALGGLLDSSKTDTPGDASDQETEMDADAPSDSEIEADNDAPSDSEIEADNDAPSDSEIEGDNDAPSDSEIEADAETESVDDSEAEAKVGIDVDIDIEIEIGNPDDVTRC